MPSPCTVALLSFTVLLLTTMLLLTSTEPVTLDTLADKVETPTSFCEAAIVETPTSFSLTAMVLTPT